MEKFKILVDIAERYNTGDDSHWYFAADMTAIAVNEALDLVGLTLDESMTITQKIEWLKGL